MGVVLHSRKLPQIRDSSEVSAWFLIYINNLRNAIFHSVVHHFTNLLYVVCKYRVIQNLAPPPFRDETEKVLAKPAISPYRNGEPKNLDLKLHCLVRMAVLREWGFYMEYRGIFAILPHLHISSLRDN